MARSTHPRSQGAVRAVAKATLLWIAVAATGAQAQQVPNPVVEGPITGGIHGRPWFASVTDLAPLGYVEEEFFFSGFSDNATPYKTRMVVRRPADPAQASGTVIIDWVNVTGGMDLETIWPGGHPQIIAERHVYVALSAQIVGVTQLRDWDAVRYGTLNHPGDDPHSFRILEQALKALRSPQGIDPLGGAPVEFVIVAGSSQSSSRLTSYISQGYEIVGLVDAFNLSRGGGNATTKRVAEELHIPMLNGLEENQGERPADSDYYRAWYQAGMAHAPFDWKEYVHEANKRDLFGGADVPDPIVEACKAGPGTSMNRGTTRYLAKAAVHWLNRWVRASAAGDPSVMPSYPRMTRTPGGALVLDADGNALGGMRYPFIEVPVGVHTGGGCPLFGRSTFWTADQIVARYPTKAEYLTQIEDAIALGVAEEWLMPIDVDEVRAEAAAFDVWTPQGAACWNESWDYPPDPLNPCLM